MNVEVENSYASELRLIFEELTRRVNKRLELSRELHIYGFGLISLEITQADADNGIEVTRFELNASEEVLQAMAAEQSEKSISALINACITQTSICTDGGSDAP